MITDFNSADVGNTMESDLCLIGSGAAGITIAREFVGTAASLIVLEGGAATFEIASQEPYQTEVVGLRYGGGLTGRARVFGGTTTLWAGQALPLFDIDFEQRDWVPYSGWPITKSELMPYYRRAERVMQVAPATYDLRAWPKANRPAVAADDPISPHFSQFAERPNFAEVYRRELAQARNVTVLTNANAVRLEATQDARSVHAVQIKSFQGKVASVVARAFVVCCGGIDSPRLLLASNSVQLAGLGNGSDVVGRFYQDHPTLTVPVTPRRPDEFQLSYSNFRHGSRAYAVKLTPSAEQQRKHRMLNVGAEPNFPATEDDPVPAARNLARSLRHPIKAQFRLRDAKAVARHPGQLVAALYRKYLLGKPPSLMSAPRLIVSGEQEPDPSSRILLSDRRDSLGMPRAVIDWHLTETVTSSFEKFLRLLAGQWARSGIGDVRLDQANLKGREAGENGGYMDVYHHLGGTRMGTDPKTSVVDPSCRVHGVENLYVGSSSVFPTGGFSNPTLTMLALCLRMADQIKLRLASLPVARGREAACA